MGHRGEFMEGEVHGIGGDQVHGYIFKCKLSGGVVHPVDMAEIEEEYILKTSTIYSIHQQLMHVSLMMVMEFVEE